MTLRVLGRLLCLVFFAGCSTSGRSPQPSASRPALAQPQSTPPIAAIPPLLAAAPAATPNSERVTFRGMCDASGAVPLGTSLFAVAADEDNILRVYDAARGGEPLYAVDVSAALDLPPGRRRAPEADIEAATRIGDYALWITSHGLSSRGKHEPGRFRFFATTTPAAGKGIAMVGRVYETLLDDMQAAPQLARFRLDRARRLPPRADGGLNIEGLTRRLGDDAVFIGFRNPRPEGKALLIPLLDPLAVVQGEPARFGQPELLELGGLGIRALLLWHDRYLIAAGSAGNEPMSRLFVWNGKDTPRALDVDLQELNPEAFVSVTTDKRVLVLSDDGTVDVDGTPCKRLSDPGKQSFRGLWVSVE